MKPSSRRMRAISTRMRLTGTLTVSWRAPAAFRTRVSRSATASFGMPTVFGRGFFGGATGLRGARSALGGSVPGSLIAPICSSVTISLRSPARFRDARQLADQRPLAEANPAEAELPHVPAGPAADLASVVGLHLVPRRPLRFQDEALLCHLLPLMTRSGTASRGCAGARAPLRPFAPSSRS